MTKIQEEIREKIDKFFSELLKMYWVPADMQDFEKFLFDNNLEIRPVQPDELVMTKEQLQKLFAGGFRISHKMFTGIGYYKDETNWKNWSSDKEMWEGIKLYFDSILEQILKQENPDDKS